MHKINRTPPSTSKNDHKSTLLDSAMTYDFQVDSDIETVSVTPRNTNKRPKPSSSPKQQKEKTSFEEKMLNLLSSWKEEQDITFKKLTSDVADMKQQVTEIQKTNLEIERSMDMINKGYESIKTSVEKLQKEKLDQRKYICVLEKKIYDMQQLSRPSSIEIRNVPSQDNESMTDLASLAIKTCKAINVNVDHPDIRDVYRVPGKLSLNRPIVVEFKTVYTKVQVLSAVRSFNKGKSTSDKLNSNIIGLPCDRRPIYVADFLPGSQRQLFHESRKFAKEHMYQFCWTQNGRIFIRKNETSRAIAISSMDCLLQSQQLNDESAKSF